MRPLLTAGEMRAVEEAFVSRGGELARLMNQAGMEVASRTPSGARTLVLAGPGKNGGDALAAARILRERGDEAGAYTFMRDSLEDLPGRRAETDGDLSGLRAALEHAEVVVDGLLGAGRRRPVEGRLADIINHANAAAQTHRIAIDIPTGVDPDSGSVEGVAFQADLTVTLGFAKRGLWGSPGAGYAGRVEIADIGLAPGSGSKAVCFLLDPEDILELLPRRTQEWNKGKSGRVLVVAGSADFSGAPSLVATAAYRAGAGLVELAVPRSVEPIVAARSVETVFTHVESESHLTVACVDAVMDAAKKAQAVALGPGLGQMRETVAFVRAALPRLKDLGVPTVLDADGLTAVAGWEGWSQAAPPKTVITPHPGEMARLLDLSIRQVQADRFSVAREAADRWNVTVVLKGADSIIAPPGQPLKVCPTGGSNLATGGTGDVLTGIIAGYLAQALPPEQAATAGVWVHGAAGDHVRGEIGQTGTLASDLWGAIPIVRKRMLAAIGLD